MPALMPKSPLKWYIGAVNRFQIFLALIVFASSCKSNKDDKDYRTSDYGDGYLNQSFMHCPLVPVHKLTGATLVGSVFFAKQTEVFCSGPVQSPACGGGERTVSSGQLLSVCQGRTYLDQSVQGIGLQFVAGLENSYQFARSQGLSAPERQLRVQVLPKRYRVFQNGTKQVTTDNLSTTYIRGQSPEISLFPNAVSSRSSSGLSSYGKHPWIAAHEVGHVLFNEQTRFHDFSFRTSSGLRHQMITGEIGARAIGPVLFGSVVAEAWSDLFASILVRERGVAQTSGSLAAVPCMMRTRDVASAQFIDGSPKVLTTQRVQIFMANTSIGLPDCNSPWFQDPHNVGAVIAFAMYQAMDAQGLTTTNAKMLVLRNWLQNIRLRMQGSSFMLRDLLVDGVRALGSSALRPETCNILRGAMPTEAAAFRSFGC